jgi:hypothetical protein
VLLFRGGGAPADDLAAGVDVSRAAVGTAKRAEINDRELWRRGRLPARCEANEHGGQHNA